MKNMLTVTVINEEHTLNATELAQACGVSLTWVTQAVELSVLHTSMVQKNLNEWRFQHQDLQRALELRQLQRRLEVDLDISALIADLQQEIRRLKGQQ